MTPEEWFRSLAPITRIYWCLAVGTTLLFTLGAISPVWFMLDFQLLINKFHIWRFFTNIFWFGPFSMPFIFQIVLLVRYFGYLEGEYYNYGIRGTADFLLMILYAITTIQFLAYFLTPMFFYGSSLVFFVIYVWSRKDPYKEVVFYGFSFKAWHTPFLLLVAGMLLGGNAMLDMLGIVVGHTWYFFTELVPKNYNRTIISTPAFWYNWVEAAEGHLTGRGNVPQSTAAPRPNWQRGQGHRLG